MIIVDPEDRMNKNFRRLRALTMSAALQGSLIALAFAQGAPAPPGPGGQPAQPYSEGQMVEATPSDEATAETELPVLYVTSVEVLRTSTEPRLDIVRVIGLASSQGWSAPQLVPTFVGKPLDDILDLQFIATVPSESEKADGFVPIGAIFPLDPGHPFKGVRVRASENAIEVKPIPGANQMQINVEDCRACIGKKFVERGQAPPGQQGIVRQEDLPKVLRWIIPSRGIRGITHNPNRLNLILSDDNTIVEAFWE
ncbi:MAG: hypothetical protein WA633_21550 [Stellaceae bacterium]